MRGRPSRLVAVAAAVVALTGCEARVYGTPPPVDPDAPQLTVVAPQGPLAPLPEAAPDEPASSFDGLDVRTKQATADAAAEGANITTVVLDRSTGRRVTNGNGRGIAIASVVKLFIADDLLLRAPPLSPDDLKSFQSMLRSSDDSAAEVFWNRGGGSAIVSRVAARYGLEGTRPPNNGMWFNTTSTAADLVRYYDMMLTGSGGLPMEKANMIVDNLAQSSPTGIDGMMPGGVYPQRFGIPEGLYAERVAVKQGWMCCIGSDWMHLSTGIVGADHRYVMAVASDQTANADTARAAITQAVRTMFPGGRI
jgi:beta-lactamase family protein